MSTSENVSWVETSDAFHDHVRTEYDRLLKLQMPDIEQGTPMYEFVIGLNDKIRYINAALKPGTLDYYMLTDADIYVSGKNDREQFVQDMIAAKNVFMFLSSVIRTMTIKEEQWRRVSIFGKI